MSFAAGTWGLGLAAALVGGAAGPPASEVPAPISPAAEAVHLAWEAPPGCPREAQVRRELGRQLGDGPNAEAGAAVRAVARITESDAGLHLSLRTETVSGVTTQEAVASDCAVLVETTALIVAFAVDPSGLVRRAEVSTAPAVEPAPEVEPAEATAAADPTAPAPEVGSDPGPPLELVAIDEPPAPEPRPGRRVRFGMRVSGGVDVGTLPAPAAGLRLAGAVLGKAWRAELLGDFWLPRTKVVEAGIGARISMWSVSARGCGVPGVARPELEFPLCGGLEAGVMRGDPTGDRVAGPETARVPWLAANASAGVAWLPRRFIAPWISAELVVPLMRAGFRVGDIEVHRAGQVGGRGMIGLEARFP